MKISIVQENPIVGDVKGNLALALSAIQGLKDKNPDLILFSEMFLTGYPPEDLLLRDDLFISVDKAINQLANHCPDLNLIIGYPRKKNQHIYNAAGLICGGKLKLSTLSRNFLTIKYSMRRGIFRLVKVLV